MILRNYKKTGLIRNDVAVIIFQEPGAYYDPQQLISKLTHIVAVVQVIPRTIDTPTLYKVNIISRPDVEPFLPDIPDPPIFEHGPEFTNFLLSKLLNGLLSAQRTPAFDKAFKEPRRARLEEFIHVPSSVVSIPSPKRKLRANSLRHLLTHITKSPKTSTPIPSVKSL